MGRFDAEQFLELIDEISPGKGYVAKKRLWDLRKAQFDLSTKQIQLISDHAKNGDKHVGRVALVAIDDIQIGLLKMYRHFRENSLADVRVFRTEEEALAWLDKA